ncbi:MAG TPA: twin-arginine translocase TatA/TatE family subunit [Armatimonadota bacterium]|nr:twin-arginine translocase TatA/TatE family subunit [Armatimonadota bacterium]HQK92471.1 twin-arginine translocase TatA/TatE family subunit [Armatimonadota bacterium]
MLRILTDSVLGVGFVGSSELLIILLLVVLLFGARKIPELMRGLGTGIKEFKKSSQDPPEPTEGPKDDAPTG